jgi:glutathione peroxidase-family protein
MRTHRHYARFPASHPEIAVRMSSINEFELKNAAGEPTTLPKAKATVIVNTASACGYTKHYAGLQVCMCLCRTKYTNVHV